MPYIKQSDRDAIHDGGRIAETPGELNYMLTLMAKLYLQKHGMSYTTINDIMGAFEGAKAEFYRRVAAPYEDKKIKENGDVY